jgi:acyl-CoA thioester hydrolase
MIAGAAVVEYRLVYREWPRLGAPIEVHSGVTALQGKTHRLSHWLVDPLSGSAYATTEAVALTFDLKTRKALQPPPAQMEALEALLTPGMSA